ncbi:uncharacterized protein LOC132618697 [Lycium barbarum]|uniref:uncharacterized protein LOC132618697 n=1 Tax=Lycium barbarum TaxID=112863 RepID=UPI00293E3DF7|nr:uncharacterized protein LOC132618697 [Lycium barbarum]
MVVVSLKPVKFYGSSLPRPRFYKPNSERVDPPVSILDPLMSWAEEAHWSMGGVSFTRHRLQGRIEGNIEKLRAERESVENKKVEEEMTCPGAPIVLKRKRRLADDESEDVGGLARKLEDEFDDVAEESGLKVVNKVKSKGEKLKKVEEESGLESSGMKTSGLKSSRVKMSEPNSSGMKMRRRRNEDDVANEVKLKGENLKKVVSVKRTSPRLAKRV